MSDISRLPGQGDPQLPVGQLPRTDGSTYSHNAISGGTVQFGHQYIVNNITAAPDGADTPKSGKKHNSKLPRLNEQEDQYIVEPRLKPHFTGRQSQLSQITKFFASPPPKGTEDRHKIVVLVGPGGSGKTQVALRYAELNRHVYWGVFWIVASDRTKVESAYIYLAQEADVGKTWTSGRDFLSDCSKPWLLVLDNVDDLQMQEDIFDFIPMGSRGHVLITTRLRDLPAHATADSLELREMDPEEAIELLLRCAYNDAIASTRDNSQDRDAAEGIAGALGYLAIALNLAGATIRRGVYSIHEYLTQYLNDRSRLINANIPEAEAKVIATWEMPFRQVEDQPSQECQDAVVLVCMFAFLHFDLISEALLQNPWTNKGKRSKWFDQLPDLFKSGSKARLRRALNVLADRSIIDRNPDTGTCSIHPYVHNWIKSRIDNTDKLKFWLERTLRLLACCDPETFTAASGLSILPHIEHCLEVAKEKAPEVLNTEEGLYESEIFASMYYANGNYRQSTEILERVLQRRQGSLLGSWRHDTILTKRSLSWSKYGLWDVGAAVKLQLEILKVQWVLRTSPLDYLHPIQPIHLPYLLTLDSLSSTLLLCLEKEWAKTTGRRAVNGLRKHLGDDDPRTWNAMFNLGRALMTVNELEEAHTLITFVVKKRRKHLGINHFDTLMARNQLGYSYLEQKRCLPIARRLMTRVLEARKTTLGKDHPYTLWSVNDLSKVDVAQGRYADAIARLEEIVPVVTKTLGAKHIGMHITKGNLARAHALASNWKQADTIINEFYGAIDPNHPEWFHYTYGRARVKSEVGQLPLAETLCETLMERGIKDKSELRFRMAVELLGHVYYNGNDSTKLDALKKRYSWIDDEHVRDPPSVLDLLIKA